jgi:hypothetical protein
MLHNQLFCSVCFRSILPLFDSYLFILRHPCHPCHPSQNLANPPAIFSHGIQSDPNEILHISGLIQHINSLVTSCVLPPSMLVDLGWQCFTKAVMAMYSSMGDLGTGTAMEAVERPKLGFKGISSLEVGSSRWLLLAERGIQKMLPEVQRQRSSAILMTKQSGLVGGPSGANI